MDFIKVYDNVLTPKECTHYINLIEMGEQHPGRVHSEDPDKRINPDIKHSFDVNFSQDYPAVTEYLITKVQKLLENYLEDVKTIIPIKSCELFSGRKYPEGEGFYKRHVDNFGPYTIKRSITILIYLNTVEGGELEFPLQKRKIDPAPGRVVMFPSYWTHPHLAHKTSKGDRYLVRTFVLGID